VEWIPAFAGMASGESENDGPWGYLSGRSSLNAYSFERTRYKVSCSLP
jgi:hypothetical protein